MSSEETCWTMLHGVAAGEQRARDAFGERYLPIVRKYLLARWRGLRFASHTDDATQEVFFEFLREDGALHRAIAEAKRSFGAYLFGVTCNVARRYESGQRQGRNQVVPEPIDDFEFAGPDEPASEIFQKGWAQALIEAAAAHLRERAGESDDRARSRVDLLELKFAEGLPVREIAKRWNEDPAIVHREYAKARKEFHASLREVIQFHHPGSPAEVEDELVQILAGFGS